MTFDDQEYLNRYPFIERVLISSEEIQRRVRQLGNEIGNDYRDSTPIFVCILKGAYPFLADLTRCVPVEHEVDFMAVSSYDGGTQSSGVVKIESIAQERDRLRALNRQVQQARRESGASDNVESEA